MAIGNTEQPEPDRFFDDEPKTAREINATVMALKKALIDRALSSEMNHHLGYL